jgi:hypothetical protein
MLASVVVGSWSILACRGPAEDQAANEDSELEVVDVDEPIDSQIRPEDDERAEVRDRGLLGVLPGDFPKDLWAYEPASIVDFGAAEAGRSYVSFRTVASPQEVSRRFQAQERARGWQVTTPASTLLTFTKDKRLVEAELEQRGNETWIRIEYPTGG